MSNSLRMKAGSKPGVRTIGVIRALQAQGFEGGDDVEIGGVVFELDP